MTRRKRRTFSKKFKEQVVQLYASGKPRAEIIKEYELTPSSFDRWVSQYHSSGSFEEKDNRTPDQEELIRLRKENQQLMMEVDILKQATLIMGESRCDKKQQSQILGISNVCSPTNS